MRDFGDQDAGPRKDRWARDTQIIVDSFRSLATGASWSGSERNHLFLGGGASDRFVRVTGISGLDDPQDSRGFALLDFDRDGFLDVALLNLGAPRLRLFRNDMADRPGTSDNRSVAVRFVGGNRGAAPSGEWSARDGFGSHVQLDLGDGTRLSREHRTEDGFMTQHTATMVIGIGRRDRARSLRVRWLSGRVQTLSDVPAGSLVTVYEDPDMSPTGEAFVVESYRRTADADGDSAWLPDPGIGRTFRPSGEAPKSSLRVYVGVTTHCASCIREIPQLRALRDAFTADEVALTGVLLERGDAAEKRLPLFLATYEPPYDVASMTDTDLDAFEALVRAELHEVATPVTIVTDRSGNVLLAQYGAPTRSALRKLLDRASGPAVVDGSR